MSTCGKTTFNNYKKSLIASDKSLRNYEKQIQAFSPERNLKLGYSIVRNGGKILRSIDQVKTKDEIETTLADGSFTSVVK